MRSSDSECHGASVYLRPSFRNRRGGQRAGPRAAGLHRQQACRGPAPDRGVLPARRQDAFQVVAVDGVCSGVLRCLSADDCADWLQAIAANISSLTKHNVSSEPRAPAAGVASGSAHVHARTSVQLDTAIWGSPKKARHGTCWNSYQKNITLR